MLVGPVLGPAGAACGAAAGAWAKTDGAAKKPIRAIDAIDFRKCTCQHSLLSELWAVEFNLNGFCRKHSVVFYVSYADLISRHTVSFTILTIQAFHVNSDLAILFGNLCFQFHFFLAAFDQEFDKIAFFQSSKDAIEFGAACCFLIVYV